MSTTAIRPLKFQLKLQDSTSHPGTDIMSFKFTRSDDQQRNQYLNYKAGQYAVVDLGTKEDPEGPMRSFTVATSPTEEESILISTRIRDTPFKKKLANLDLGIGKYYYHKPKHKRVILKIKPEKIMGLSIHPAFYFLAYSPWLR